MQHDGERFITPGRFALAASTDGREWEFGPLISSNVTVQDFAYANGTYIFIGLRGFVASGDDPLNMSESRAADLNNEVTSRKFRKI